MNESRVTRPLMPRQQWIIDPTMLRTVMSRRGVNASALARAVSVSPSLIRNWRNGSYVGTTSASLIPICRALGIRPEVIATRRERNAA